jgi:hypothetical protein
MPNKSFNQLILAVFLVLFFSACHNFYKAPSVSQNDLSVKIDSLTLSKRYFVLRNGINEAFEIKNIILSEDQKTANITLDTLSIFNQYHLKNGPRNNFKYKKYRVDESSVTNEVHIYIPYNPTIKTGNYILNLNQVQEIEVLQHDKARTTSSYVIGAIGYTVGAFLVAAAIVAATKSSCPFVSAYDGTNFVLQGEIYGGAIYPQLARHDYLPLKMSPLSDGSLQIKISNELKEHQYTDIADLMVISHNKNIKAMVDESGYIYTIKNPQQPTSAILNNKKNVLSAISEASDNEILYMDDESNSDGSNQLNLKFTIPAKANDGKLILTVKNSYWLDLLYGKLAEGLGTYYAKYMKQQKKKPAEQLNQWINDQQIPLVVSVKTISGWQQVTAIPTIGPLAAREMVVSIDLSNIKNDVLDLKISSGFMFWEIDYIAMDFSENDKFHVQTLSPVKAIDELGRSVLPQLQKEDKKYLVQPEIGNVTTIIYKPKDEVNHETTHTYVLKTKGYYEHIRNFTTKPDIKFLNQFKKPNSFPLYGMALHKNVREENLKSLAVAKK